MGPGPQFYNQGYSHIKPTTRYDTIDIGLYLMSAPKLTVGQLCLAHVSTNTQEVQLSPTNRAMLQTARR